MKLSAEEKQALRLLAVRIEPLVMRGLQELGIEGKQWFLEEIGRIIGMDMDQHHANSERLSQPWERGAEPLVNRLEESRWQSLEELLKEDEGS